MSILSGVSKVDPFNLIDFPSNAYKDTTGKIITTPFITPGEKTGVFVTAGQSNGVNVVPTKYTPLNVTKVDQISVYDGGTYRAVDPVIGCDANSGNMFTQTMDKLVSAAIFRRVIFVPISMGGTSSTDWAPGGLCNSRLITAKRRLDALHLPITAWLWLQGEADHGATQADYAARLAAIINTPRGLGDSAPWFIAQCTYISGATDANVRAAQAAAPANIVNVFAGPDTDTLTGTAVYRNPADDTHWSSAGAVAASDLWKAALDAVF